MVTMISRPGYTPMDGIMLEYKTDGLLLALYFIWLMCGKEFILNI